MKPVLRNLKLLTCFAGLILVAAVSVMPFAGDALEEPATPVALRVYFSPDGGCTQAIVNALGGARQQILVQAYEMTSARIKSALLAASRRGVQVKAIFDPDALKEENSMAGALGAGGIPVFIDSYHRPGLAHNKVMVIDQAVVITGSFNFTNAAESRNAENLLVIRDPALAAAYGSNFAAHLAHSSALGAAEIHAPKSTYHRRYYYPRYHRRYYW